MRVKNPLAITNSSIGLSQPIDIAAKHFKALPVGEAPEPPPVKQIEVPPPGWQTRKVTLASGEEVTQWFRAGLQRNTMREAWDLAIVEAHETLSAVAGRYVLVEETGEVSESVSESVSGPVSESVSGPIGGEG